jgi:hypothetical protein
MNRKVARELDLAERLMMRARFFERALRGDLDARQREHYERCVLRAIRELDGIPPGDKDSRALILQGVRLFSWRDERKKGESVPTLTPKHIDRRVIQAIGWVAGTDRALAGRLSPENMRAALVAYSTNIGGKGRHAGKRFDEAMNDLLRDVGLAASMRQVRRRSSSFKP